MVQVTPPAVSTGSYTSSLPTVDDPDQAYANITRQEYEDFIANYRDFELDTLQKAQTDTSLIDQARIDAPKAAELTRGIQQRNISRYGGQLTNAQNQQMERALASGSTLGGIQSERCPYCSRRGKHKAIV